MVVSLWHYPSSRVKSVVLRAKLQSWETRHPTPGQQGRGLCLVANDRPHSITLPLTPPTAVVSGTQSTSTNKSCEDTNQIFSYPWDLCLVQYILLSSLPKLRLLHFVSKAIDVNHYIQIFKGYGVVGIEYTTKLMMMKLGTHED